jgi:PAS domain S-box-containing protein
MKPPTPLGSATELRRRAEARLQKRRENQRPKAGDPKSAADPRRLAHELQVHQVELEMQNAALQEARDKAEALLEKYTDLYDFAPVGYFSLDEQGIILEVNLTGATLLGVARSQLVQRRLQHFVAPSSRPDFQTFLAKAFIASTRHLGEVLFERKDGASFWADLQAAPAVSLRPPKWCRVAVSDITAFKRAEAAQHRLEALAVANQELKREISRRQAAEKGLQQSEQATGRLLAESLRFQAQLREMSRQILSAQDEERKRISRELHDIVAQTLTGINVQLATLKTEATHAVVNPEGLTQHIAQAQQLVEASVDLVHQFARELRPAVLDDLGLIPALHSLLKRFMKETGVRASLTAFAGVKRLGEAQRTALYRVAQEALKNVARHAQASRVEVSLRKVARAVLLEIHDDGKSFDVKRMLHPQRNTRLGLLGMRERVEMVGGRFTVQSAPGRGATVQAQVPFDPRPRLPTHL